MAYQSDAVAAHCVDLVLTMLAETRGQHAIIRSNRVPVMTRDDCRYRISDRAVSRSTVARIAGYLLPNAELQALAEIGETRCHVPRRRHGIVDDFIIDVTDRDGDLCVDIVRHMVDEPDEVPASVWRSRLDC